MTSDWSDSMGSSTRSDGARIGEFPEADRYMWWLYPPGWRPRGEVEALGPFNSRREAKDAMTAWLGLDTANI